MLDLIGDRLRQEKIKFLRFDGDTALSERRDLIDQFQSEESDINIFIISLYSKFYKKLNIKLF